jgi:hypothetical protein
MSGLAVIVWIFVNGGPAACSAPMRWPEALAIYRMKVDDVGDIPHLFAADDPEVERLCGVRT